MERLYELIVLARNENQEAMLEIIDICQPILKKYTRLLNYDEDYNSELTLSLIMLVKKDMPLDTIRSHNDGAMLNYIKRAIHNQYIVFLKEQRKLRESEVACDQESFIDFFDDKLSDNNEFDDILLQDAMMNVLSEKERICIEMIVLRGFTAQHVADKLGVTKQAVNQCKNRALAKLKDLLQ